MIHNNPRKLVKLVTPGWSNACWWLSSDSLTQWSHYSIWSMHCKCHCVSIMSRAMLSVCRYVSVWWAGVIGPHTGVCMLTSSLMHQLIGLLRQPDIFTHSQSLWRTHIFSTHVPVTHTHAHTYDGARDSYSHMYTECVNKHTWANTSMSPHAQAARRVYFQMNSLSQCWLRVKNDTWTHRSYCTHTYCKKEKRKPMTTKPHCKTRAMTEFSPQKSKHV